MIYTTKCVSPLGEITLAERDGALLSAWIEGQKYFLNSIKENTENRRTPILCAAEKWLFRYFDGQRPKISELALAPIGSAFRQTVWEILREIPYGKTTTYGEIAKEVCIRMGRERMSAQAVGGAIGHNPISIIVPCHRVVGSGGSLTGYAGGVELKIKLLEHEGVDLSGFFVPKHKM